ncbi:MAG TPA: DUF4268 domain-containing protein [Bellilinea sp.]|nr:DUF4268 domain-containing protein [Bellilinea sp.]
MPFTAQDLIEGRPQPVTTDSQATVTSALELMIENDFSQLPVIDEERRPKGLITSDGILRGLSNFGVALEKLHVRDVSEPYRAYSLDDNIFDLLEGLRNQPAVLIVDAENCLQGIVTNYDTTLYFRRRAEDMMLIDDIESMLQEHINAAFTDKRTGERDKQALQAAIDEVYNAEAISNIKAAINRYVRHLDGHKANKQWIKEVCGSLEKRGKKLGDLALNQYTALLLHKSRWSDYSSSFSVDNQAIRNLLEGVRDTRNVLAHFRNEISNAQREQLRFCLRWLEQNPPVVPESVEAEEIPEEPEIEELTPVDEQVGESESRYSRLALFLRSLPQKTKRISLTFKDIEQILDHELPPSAQEHRSWWANDSVSHSQSIQWLDAGWRVAGINMSEKTIKFARSEERERMYIDFFSALLAQFRERATFDVKEVSPDGSSWVAVQSLPYSGKKVALLGFAFTHGQRFRAELYIDTGDRDETKAIFDALLAQRYAIEEDVGEELTWERLDEKRATRIALYTKGSITDDAESLANLREWAINAMNRLEQGIVQRAEEVMSGSYLHSADTESYPN